MLLKILRGLLGYRYIPTYLLPKVPAMSLSHNLFVYRYMVSKYAIAYDIFNQYIAFDHFIITASFLSMYRR